MSPHSPPFVSPLSQVESENKERAEVLAKKHAPGAVAVRVHASGRGSRRGMMAEARADAESKRQANLVLHQNRLESTQQEGQALARAAIGSGRPQRTQAVTP